MTLKAMQEDMLRRLERANHNPVEDSIGEFTMAEQLEMCRMYCEKNCPERFENLYEQIEHDYPTDAETAEYNRMQEVEERYLMQEWANSR